VLTEIGTANAAGVANRHRAAIPISVPLQARHPIPGYEERKRVGGLEPASPVATRVAADLIMFGCINPEEPNVLPGYGDGVAVDDARRAGDVGGGREGQRKKQRKSERSEHGPHCEQHCLKQEGKKSARLS